MGYYKKIDAGRSAHRLKKTQAYFTRKQERIKRRKNREARWLHITSTGILDEYSSGEGLGDLCVLTSPTSISDAQFVSLFGTVSNNGVKGQLMEICATIHESDGSATSFQVFIFPSTDIDNANSASGLSKTRTQLLLDGEEVEVKLHKDALDSLQSFFEASLNTDKKHVFVQFNPFSAFCKRFQEGILGHKLLRLLMAKSFSIDFSDKSISGTSKIPVKIGATRSAYVFDTYIQSLAIQNLLDKVVELKSFLKSQNLILLAEKKRGMTLAAAKALSWNGVTAQFNNMLSHEFLLRVYPHFELRLFSNNFSIS